MVLVLSLFLAFVPFINSVATEHDMFSEGISGMAASLSGGDDEGSGNATVEPLSGDIEIYTIEDLYDIRDDLSADYVLMNDLDFEDCDSYVECDNMTQFIAGEGWEPIGDDDNPFEGNFDGEDHDIYNLHINRSAWRQGLFGVTEESSIENIGLKNVSLEVSRRSAGLVGININGDIYNSHVIGNLYVGQRGGGLVGENEGGIINNSYFIGNISSDDWPVGGLVGWNEGIITNSHSEAEATSSTGELGGLVGRSYGTVKNSWFGGSVTGTYWATGGLVALNSGNITNTSSRGNVYGAEVGGLVGGHVEGEISDSYFIGNVTGSYWATGGLVGYLDDSKVYRSYSHGNVSTVTDDNQNVGGLVGYVKSPGSVHYSHASVNVDTTQTEDDDVGGLFGYHEGTVTNSFSTGNLTYHASDTVGGLIGGSDGYATDSFWDMDTSGMDTSDGGTGKTTEEMKDISTFDDTSTEGLDDPWNITTVGWDEVDDEYTWNIVDDSSYPFLSTFGEGQPPPPFTFEIDTNQNPGDLTYAFQADKPDELHVDWGDGNNDTITDTGSDDVEISHTYDSPGNYLIEIEGTAERVTLGGSFDHSTERWTNFGEAVTDVLTLPSDGISGITSAERMFSYIQVETFTADLNEWDVSSVTEMSGMFRDTLFNQDISNWDTSKVENMSSMFKGARSFNQPLSNWDVSNVTDMGSMFRSAESFDQNI